MKLIKDETLAEVQELIRDLAEWKFSTFGKFYEYRGRDSSVETREGIPELDGSCVRFAKVPGFSPEPGDEISLSGLFQEVVWRVIEVRETDFFWVLRYREVKS